LDLHLDPSDACAINWGASISSVTLGDIDGDARPQGPGWDVGADEVAAATPLPGDFTPPLRFNGAPSGTLPAGTIQAVLSLTTNEIATCRYDIAAGIGYDAMLLTFDSTDASQHSTPVGELIDGGSYPYFVRCRDSAGNTNPSDFVISFDIAEGDVTPPTIDNLAVTTTTGSTVTITLTWTTDEPATSTVNYGLKDPYGASETVPGLRESHSITMDCLDRKTTYHLQAVSVDGDGNGSQSGDITIAARGKRLRGTCPG
jgi:hypothetical protein